MATSGSFQSNNDKYCNLYVEWKVTGQSIANNTSTVQVDVYLKHHALNIPSKTLSINFGGTIKNITTPAINIGSSANTTKLGSATLTAWHNANGTKSLTISATMPIDAMCDGTQWGSITASGTATFNQIARPTTPTLSATTVELGSSVTITMSRNISSLTHTLTYSIGANSGTIGTGLGTSTTWTAAIELAHQLPKSTSGIVTITCKTYSGSTLVGTKSVTLVVTVPSSIKPTFTSPTFSDPTGCLTKYGNYVQNHSKMQIDLVGNGVYSSTVTGFKIEVNGNAMTLDASSGTVTTGLLTTVGANTIKITVTDSRGRSNTANYSRTVIEYIKPKAVVYAYRSDASGNENPEGAYIRAGMSGTLTTLNDKNSKLFKIQYKTADEDESAFDTNTIFEYTSDYTVLNSRVFPADINTVYNIRAVATDDFGTSMAVMDVSTSYTIIDFKADGKGIAFGKVSTDAGFDVDMDAQFRKGLKSNQVTTTYILGNKGKALIDSTVELVNDIAPYVALTRLRSTNGYFTIGSVASEMDIIYTAKDIVDEGTNAGTNFWRFYENGTVRVAGAIQLNNGSAYYINGSGTTKLNELQCVGDVVAKLGSTDQCSLVGTNERINKLQPHPYSLIKDVDLTTTQTTFTTVDGRKFSDYGTLIISMGAGTEDVRATLTVPRTIFDGTDNFSRTFYLDCWSNNGQTFNQVAVKYASDTQITAWLPASSTVCKRVNIYGIKTDTALSERGIL